MVVVLYEGVSYLLYSVFCSTVVLRREFTTSVSFNYSGESVVNPMFW